MRFNHPEFLYALLAVILPVIIHLFNFRRHKKLFFSNIAFLKNITIETKKQNRLKHLLVLLARILAIVFIVLAFAGPYFPRNEAVMPGSGVSMIYLDNSYSMKAEGERGRLFDEALRQAAGYVKKSPKDERFYISTNNPAKSALLVNKQEAGLFLGKTVVGENRQMLSAVIKKENRIALKNNLHANKVFLFSDFQKNQTDILNTSFDTSSFYYFLPYSHKTLHNLYIDSCSFENPDLLPGKQLFLRVRVRNVSASPVEKISVKLIVDGKQKSLAGIDIPANGSALVKLGFRVENQGWHKGIVRIDDYPITFDDKLFFTFKIKNSVEILEINDKVSGAFDYPRTLFSSDSIFNFTSVTYLKINNYRFSKYNLIILNGLTTVSSGLAQLLVTFVNGGGNLLVIPSANDNNFDINALLKKFDAGSFVALDTLPGRVAALKENSPLFEKAISKIPGNPDFPSVYKHFRLQYHYRSGMQTLLSLLNGDDLVSMKKSGNGKIFLFSVPLDRNFSNIQTHPLFTVLMYGIATQGTGAGRLYYFLGAANTIVVNDNLPANRDKALEIVLPSGKKFIPAQRRQQGKIILSLENEGGEEGFYTILSGDKPLEICAFNYNRLESDPGFYTALALDSLLKIKRLPHYTVARNSTKILKEVINTPQKASFLWKLFIIFALLMLLIETIILRFWK